MNEHIAEQLRALAVPVDSLNTDPANARLHSDRNVGAVKASMAKFGQRAPVVVQRNGMVVRAGNARLQAARELGWTHIAALVVEEGDLEATAFAIADNRTAELAEWDDEVLKRLLREIGDDPEFDVELTGFEEAEIAEMLDEGYEPDETDDEVPAVPDDPVTHLGDVWTMGEHRLICGDSTDAATVEKLMAGERAAFCLTDPPYRVSYEKSQGSRQQDRPEQTKSGVHQHYHEGDLDPTDILRFMAVVPSDVMVWSYPIDRHFQTLAKAYIAHGWTLKKELVWVKESFSFWMSAK